MKNYFNYQLGATSLKKLIQAAATQYFRRAYGLTEAAAANRISVAIDLAGAGRGLLKEQERNKSMSCVL